MAGRDGEFVHGARMALGKMVLAYFYSQLLEDTVPTVGSIAVYMYLLKVVI